MIFALILQLIPVLAIVGLYYPSGVMALVILVLFPFYRMDKNVSAVIFYATTFALSVIAIISDDFYPVLSLFAIAMVGWQLNQQHIAQDTLASMARKAKHLSLFSLIILLIIVGLYSLRFSLPIGWALAIVIVAIGCFISAILVTQRKKTKPSDTAKYQP